MEEIWKNWKVTHDMPQKCMERKSPAQFSASDMMSLAGKVIYFYDNFDYVAVLNY